MKKFVILLVLVLGILGIFVLTNMQPNKTNNAETEEQAANNLYPEKNISHAHGLTVDSADPNKLYVATHYGLFVLVNETDLYRIGKSKDDYMGFSVHPINAQTFFSSGHPSTGGNLGVQKSEDNGESWEKVSNGANGPVDFHAMTVHAANPDIMYGYYAGALQRSINGGKDWEILASQFPSVVNFATDPSDENIVFVSTGRNGLLLSNDKGLNWTVASEELKGTTVTALAIDPRSSKTLLSFLQKLGLAKSTDSGKTWQKISENFGEDSVLYIAFDKNTPNKVFALTKDNALYKSTNSGDSWLKIR